MWFHTAPRLRDSRDFRQQSIPNCLFNNVFMMISILHFSWQNIFTFVCFRHQWLTLGLMAAVRISCQCVTAARLWVTVRQRQCFIVSSVFVSFYTTSIYMRISGRDDRDSCHPLSLSLHGLSVIGKKAEIADIAFLCVMTDFPKAGTSFPVLAVPHSHRDQRI